jgi:hypothetical protein
VPVAPKPVPNEPPFPPSAVAVTKMFPLPAILPVEVPLTDADAGAPAPPDPVITTVFDPPPPP